MYVLDSLKNIVSNQQLDELRKFTPWSYLEKTLMNKWYDRAIMPQEPEGSGEGKYDAGVTISM